jgi:predicted O-linked N-acetylglucosamine transferase (SPINDLY family)
MSMQRAQPPTDPLEAMVLKALDMIDAERPADAEAICRRVLAKSPHYPHGLRALSNALFLQRKYAAAEHYATLAEQHAPPNDPLFLHALARQFRQLGPNERVSRIFRKAIAIDPAEAEYHIGLTENLLALNEFVEGATAARAGIARVPTNPDLRFNNIVATLNLGRAEEASALADDLVTNAPKYTPALLLRSTIQHYAGLTNAAQSLADAQAYWERELPHIVPLASPPRRKPGPLRVGFLSPDLREHSVAYFIRPIIEHLDRERFVVACYMSCPQQDAVTERIRKASDIWRDVSLGTQAAVANCIRNDDIDVIVDLAGHTAGGNMFAFAMKPARVHVTYLGYPGTTGLPTMDCRFVDAHTDPASSPYDAQEHASEALVRLDPCFLCYTPSEDAPPVATRDAGSPITFGSFNAMKKTTPRTLQLWSRVLASVPGSRLYLKNSSLKNMSLREDFLARLADAGIARDRVELAPFTASTREHLTCYGNIDIALDTYPYHGTTTTCEALFMGVPVISLIGDAHVSRVGVSVLHAAGYPDWLARSEDDYVAIAQRLAANRAALASQREQLRPRMLASALCDAAAMAKRFGDAIERIARERHVL